MDHKEKMARYMALFGLSPGFAPDDLSSAYRALAKLNHPDASPDPESEMRMIIINEGYAFLKSHVPDISDVLIYESKKAHDPAYVLYKSAFSIMSAAFADYFGEGDKALTDNLSRLKIELLRAKKDFAECISQYPKSSWTADAIDRVFSINKWLESGN